MTDTLVSERREGYSWARNECCQCHEVGSVWNEHCDENREMSCPTPISWVCAGCNGYVCINCVYTIPGSKPLEIACPTSCSQTCRDTLVLKNELFPDYQG